MICTSASRSTTQAWYLLGLLLHAQFHIHAANATHNGPTSHCYETIKTDFSEESSRPANCIETAEDGLVSRLFHDNRTHQYHAYPGLWDGHGHLLQYGELLHSVNLFGSRSLDEALARIVEYAELHPKAGTQREWIRGVGWDQAAFGRMPTAADFESDDRLKGMHLMLDRVDVHCHWVSQAVLDLLPSPFPHLPGGEVVTEPGPGVFCDSAMQFVMQYWPRPSKAKKTEMVRSANRELNAVGIVGIHDAGVMPENLKLFQELSQTDDWTLRVYAMLECRQRNTFCPDDVSPIVTPSGKLTMRSVKLFADGALGSWGSSMLSPYSDKPSSTGSLLLNSSTLTQLAVSWSTAGYQVNIHAIGDRANRYAVDAFEAALSNLCPQAPPNSCQEKHRFRIEHAQIVHPQDQARMAEMGIIPSIQPTHATSDMAYAEDRLGPVRTRSEAYRMRSFLPLRPVLGSDFPVEPPNPFEGLYAAVTRKSPRTGLGKAGSQVGWYADETLELRDALKGFTAAPARAAFLEGKAGVLRDGAWADWIVLDRRLEEMDVEDLRKIRVRETWVAGKCVYRRSEADEERRERDEL